MFASIFASVDAVEWVMVEFGYLSNMSLPGRVPGGRILGIPILYVICYCRVCIFYMQASIFLSLSWISNSRRSCRGQGLIPQFFGHISIVDEE